MKTGKIEFVQSYFLESIEVIPRNLILMNE